MKNIIGLIVLIFLFVCPKAETQWVNSFYLGTNEYIYQLCAVDTCAVWALAQPHSSSDTSFVYKMNGYGNWHKMPFGIFMATSRMTCIAAIDTLRAFVGTYNGNIYGTTDGGYTWKLLYSFGGSGFINDIKFSKTNRLVGYANCDPPGGVNTPFKILKTVNGGLNWTLFTPTVSGNYVGMAHSSCVTDSNHYWMGLNCQNTLCGQPRILLTTNGGAEWVARYISHPADYVVPMEFNGNNSIGFCSSFGVIGTTYIHKSVNLGYTWTNYYIPIIDDNQTINTIDWIEGTHTWYYSTSSIQNPPIFKSLDDGANWKAMAIENNSDQINYVSFFRKGNGVWGYAATLNGIIFTLVKDSVSTVNINKIENEFPDKYSLSQNYPNPFNPSTNIRYSIPSIANSQSSMVKLVVLDILGKEVATLVNEKQSTGTYEVKFDGTNLPSGVYYYKLSIDNVPYSVKKMVLLK